MILISYDIHDDILRSRFSKYIKKYGHRIQYSVYEITNSKRLLSIIIHDISSKYECMFGQSDSVIIIETGESSKITRWGYERNVESDIIVID